MILNGKRSCEEVRYFPKQFRTDVKISENMEVSPPSITNFLVGAPMLYRALEVITIIFTPNDIRIKQVIFF